LAQFAHPASLYGQNQGRVMKSLVVISETVTAARRSLSPLPDDRLFVAVLASWVLFVALVTYVLLGWLGAGAILAVGALAGIGTIAIGSRGPAPRSAADPTSEPALRKGVQQRGESTDRRPKR
jgi:hypothetical protein